MAFEEASSGKDPRLPEVMATTGPAAAARRLGYVSIEVIFLARASWYRPEWVSDIGRRLNDWWDVGQNGLLRWRLFGQEQIVSKGTGHWFSRDSSGKILGACPGRATWANSPVKTMQSLTSVAATDHRGRVGVEASKPWHRPVPGSPDMPRT